MSGYFAAGRLTQEERENILDQHRHVYDGYRTMQPEVKNEQPLYVQDFAKDKLGAVVNNKGEVKAYTNVGINEQVEEKEMCEQCGGQMTEGICEQCGTGGEMEESEHKSHRKSGKNKRHYYKEAEVSEYETGHLDDIYDESDLNPNDEFDYVKGASNRTNAFHIKEQDEDDVDNFEDPDNEDDGFEDINASEVTDGELEELGTHDLKKGKKYKYKSPSFDDEVEFDFEVEDEEGGDKMYKFKGKDSMGHLMAGKGVEKFIDYLDLDEQGYTGGGNAPDMDISNIEPSYIFKSKGPKEGDGPFSEDAPDMDLDGEGEAYNFQSGGPDEVFPTEEIDEYETMESAWADEIDEVDVSGSQGIYGDMNPAYDFDSKGPGKAGPYQRFSYSEEYSGEDEDAYWEKDLEDDELDLDFEKFNPRDKSWEEITAYTGEDEFGGVDEDIKESLILQKNKIMEMMNRMKVIK